MLINRLHFIFSLIFSVLNYDHNLYLTSAITIQSILCCSFYKQIFVVLQGQIFWCDIFSVSDSYDYYSFTTTVSISRDLEHKYILQSKHYHDNITYIVVLLGFFTMATRLLYEIYDLIPHCLSSSLPMCSRGCKKWKRTQRDTLIPTQSTAGCQTGGIRITSLQRPTYWQISYASHTIYSSNIQTCTGQHEGRGREGLLEGWNAVHTLPPPSPYFIHPSSMRCRNNSDMCA